jgi:hypothetical protein
MNTDTTTIPISSVFFHEQFEAMYTNIARINFIIKPTFRRRSTIGALGRKPGMKKELKKNYYGIKKYCKM